MPSIRSGTTVLPYIDAQPDTSSIAAADALIRAEMAPASPNTLHPSIPTTPTKGFPDSITELHILLAKGTPLSKAVDISRYEALDAPDAGDVPAWQATLRKAYVSAEYMRGREVNLSLLEAYGKNAWLIGNSRLEDILAGLERDLDAAKLDLEQIERARKSSQEAVAGEVHGLSHAWRKGVGRMLETQAAAENLRQEILRRKAQGSI